MKKRAAQIACVAGLVSFHSLTNAYAGTKLYSPHVEEGAMRPSSGFFYRWPRDLGERLAHLNIGPKQLDCGTVTAVA